MVYSQKFVAVVKAGGKILREKEGNEVLLPFGSEYSLLLKNLEARKALVKVSVDGKDVTGSSGIIIQPNSELELEGILDQ